jgi:hypothetical protein
MQSKFMNSGERNKLTTHSFISNCWLNKNKYFPNWQNKGLLPNWLKIMGTIFSEAIKLLTKANKNVKS